MKYTIQLKSIVFLPNNYYVIAKKSLKTLKHLKSIKNNEIITTRIK